MLKKGENIYLRKDQRWEGRYHKGRNVDGKIKYGYVYGKTYEEVKRKLIPLKKESAQLQELYGKSTMTYKEWVEECWNDISRGLKPATVASYYYKIKTYLLPYIGSFSLYELNEEKISEMMKNWQDKGLKESSCRVILRLLSKILKQAQRKEIMTRNICEDLPKIKSPHSKIGALSVKEQRRLENVVENYQNEKGQAVMVALHTGLRIGEIAALKWRDIDFERKIITVNHTYQRISNERGGTQLNYGTPKTLASFRVIPMSNKVLHTLKKLQKNTKTNYVFSVKGKPCEPRLITYHFHCIRKIAGLNQLHFHQLRHTFATRCLENSSDVPSVSAIMGHASTQMTLDIYADSLLDQRWAVINKMNKSR